MREAPSKTDKLKDKGRKCSVKEFCIDVSVKSERKVYYLPFPVCPLLQLWTGMVDFTLKHASKTLSYVYLYLMLYVYINRRAALKVVPPILLHGLQCQRQMVVWQ